MAEQTLYDASLSPIIPWDMSESFFFVSLLSFFWSFVLTLVFDFAAMRSNLRLIKAAFLKEETKFWLERGFVEEEDEADSFICSDPASSTSS